MIRTCGAKDPRTGLVCTCPAGHGEHQAWDHEAGEYVVWPAEAPAPLPWTPRTRAESNALCEREDARNYDLDRGREPWRPDGGNIWRWL